MKIINFFGDGYGTFILTALRTSVLDCLCSYSSSLLVLGLTVIFLYIYIDY